MSVYTYKCPNCNAEITYFPSTEEFGCEYCGVRYTKAEFDALYAAQAGEAALKDETAEQNRKQEQTQEQERAAFEENTRVYNCPSCGAEVIADTTTAATFCYYCHSPVMLTDKLTGNYKPDRVIPFAIDKAEVKSRFIAWCKKKRFIRPDFCDESQMEKITGVYFPFWVVDGKAKAKFQAKATQVRTWIVGETEYTETKVYSLRREGEAFFNDITVKALSREDVGLLNGVYPYETEEMPAFSMPYLSGFFAEKRDVEREGAKNTVYSIMGDAAQNLLRDTAKGFGALSDEQCEITPIKKSEEWLYALLPAWMLTYDYKGEKYYYAMNAQTGKIAGRVPVSGKKLAILFGGIVLAATAIGCLLGGLL